MRKILLYILLLFSPCLWAVTYTPKTVPQPWLQGQSRYVTNPDGILTTAEVNAIIQVAEQINAASGVEVATVVLTAIDRDAFDFSLELFNHWGIGDREKNRGVLILFALESRDIRITTGGGVEGLLPDARCQQILDDNIIPALSDGKYGKGLLQGNQAIARILTSDAALAELLLGYHARPVTEEPWNILAFLCVFFIFVLLFLYRMIPPCPQCHTREVRSTRKVIHEATYKSTGLGRTTYTCRHCGHTWEKDFVIPRKERNNGGGVYVGGGGHRSGGGGFSSGGFGGGVSFGGGAGGKF